VLPGGVCFGGGGSFEGFTSARQALLAQPTICHVFTKQPPKAVLASPHLHHA
jgi:hypothetical protein